MKSIITISLVALFSAFPVFLSAQKVKAKKEFKKAAEQATYMLATIDSMETARAAGKLVAPRTSVNGQLKMVKDTDWTSGFFAGNLWYLYEQTGKEDLLAAARKFTALLEPIQFFAGHHDLGFMMYCSYGNGFRLTGDTAYRRIIIQSAKTLSTRFTAYFLEALKRSKFTK